MKRFFPEPARLFPQGKWGDALVLFSGVTVYVLLASSTISKFSIWFDEAFGSYLIRFNFIDLTRYTANDVHPPLYYWVLKLWSMAFGDTETSIRSLSIFFAAITIIFAFILVLRSFGRKAAYLSLLLLILSPMFIRYGQEARMYTMLTTIVVVATYVLLYASETKKRSAWVTYGILIALGMLTQYFAALVWVAHLVWLYVARRKERILPGTSLKRTFDRGLITAYSVAIVLYCFWLPFFVMQFLTIQGHGFWIKPVSTATLPDFLTNVMLFSDSSGAQSWLALGMYVLIGIFGYFVYRLLRELRGTAYSAYLLLLCIVVVPPVLLLLLSMPPLRSAFVDRYLLASVVFLMLFMGTTLALSYKVIGWRVQAGILFVLVAMMSIGINNQSVTGNYNRSSGQSNNTRQLIEAVRAKDSATVPILTTTPWIFYEASIYDTPESPIYYVNETTQYKYGSLTALAENDMHKIRDLDAFDEQHKDIWVIGNIKDVAPKPLRGNWQERDVIVINDDVTKKPLFKAVRFSVE